PGAHPAGPLRLACLTALRLVLELLVSEKELLTGRPDELRPAVHTRQGLVLELHRSPPLFVDTNPVVRRSEPRRATPIRAGASCGSAFGPTPVWLAACRPVSGRRSAS